MHIHYFSNRSSRRLIPLGVHKSTVFFYLETDSFFEFYAIDISFPTNWHQIWRFQRDQLSYGFPNLSSDSKFLYVVFLKIGEEVTFGVQRFDIIQRKEEFFRFASDIQGAIEIPLERITVRSGENGELCLFDRTIVQGEIPFWSLRLREETKTFAVFPMPIGIDGDDSERNSSLFTIAIDPVNRCFAKLMSPHKMLVFTESRQKWEEYMIPPEHSLEEIFGTTGFPIEENRSLRETYGTHGHRVGAMQTRLTFHDLGGSVVARMIHTDKRNTTALVEFDHETQEIRVKKLATFNLDNSVSKMFYLIASSQLHVFFGVHNSAIVHIKTASLEEIVGCKMQKLILKDGYSQELSQISTFQQLLSFSYLKYSKNDKKEKEKEKEEIGFDLD